MIRIDDLRFRTAALLIIIAVVAVYANSLLNGFAYDDVFIIQRNPRVHQLSDLGSIWLTPYWPQAGKMLGLYRPLTIFGYAIQWAIVGDSPWFFHLVNMILHAGVSVLVFVVLRRFTGARGALAGALIFAVHPLHTEAVSNVVGQAELLAAAGALAACAVYLGRDPERGLTRLRLGAICILYLLGMLAKEGAIVLPALLLLLDLADGRIQFTRSEIISYVRRTAVPLGVLSAVALGYLILRIDVLGSIGGSNAGPSLPYLREEHRVLSALRAWPEFARLLFFPLELSADYSPAVILPVESWTPMAILGAALLGLTVVLAIITPVRPALGLGAGWFLVTVLPVSNLFFPVGILVAERTLYLPSFAVAAFAAYAWVAMEREMGTRRMPLFALGAIVLVLLGGRTVIRNPDWKDTRAVFEALLRDHPESYRAHWAATSWTLEVGDTLAAREHWEMAYRLWPRDARFLSEYGAAQMSWKNYDRAVELLEEAVVVFPGLLETEMYLGMAYVQVGRFSEALEAVKQAAPKIGPMLLLFDIRGRAHFGLEQYGEAAAAFRAATRQPGGNNWAIWTLLARSLERAGYHDSALEAIQVARDLAGDDPDIQRRIREQWAGAEGGLNFVDSATQSQNAIGVGG